MPAMSASLLHPPNGRCSADAPIGVFDSGVGGLSVLRAIRTTLPHEDLLYVADSGHIPYGEKPVDYIQQRSLAIARFLVGQGAKALVIACNTATAAAAALLRATFSTPIVAMEPAVKPAAGASKAAVVGVLATTGTLTSRNYADLVARFGQGVHMLAQECPGLAMQVEAGDLSGPATRALVERYTAPLLAAGADTLVLGCTHYPFLAPLIAEVVGPQVRLIDSGDAVARRLHGVLAVADLLATDSKAGQERFWSSGDVGTVQAVISRLWGAPVIVRSLPD
jgi:glutamate racemase